jgi:hypothetical protein
MGGFTKFDPHSFLESEAPGRIPAKAAKLAKPFHEPDRTLATLAALAAHGPGSQNPAAYHARAELLAPLFAPMSPADGEPSFGKPYATRCGRVEERDGLVLHFCVECGAWGAFGYGVKLRAGELGRWYCAAHRPGTRVEEDENNV